jgi:hypothetical protein
MIYISILWIFHVFQLHLHIDSQLKGCSSISVSYRWFNYRLIFTHGDTSWEKKKGRPTINIKRPYQYSFMTHIQWMKIIKRIYNWRSTLYTKGNPWFSIPLSVSISNQKVHDRQHLNRSISSIQLALSHALNYTQNKLIVRVVWEQTFLIKKLI